MLFQGRTETIYTYYCEDIQITYTIVGFSFHSSDEMWKSLVRSSDVNSLHRAGIATVSLIEAHIEYLIKYLLRIHPSPLLDNVYQRKSISHKTLRGALYVFGCLVSLLSNYGRRFSINVFRMCEYMTVLSKTSYEKAFLCGMLLREKSSPVVLMRFFSKSCLKKMLMRDYLQE